MIVAELIEFLKTQDQTLPIVYSCCSDWDKMEINMIYVQKLCLSRPDGHVQGNRKDKLTTEYLCFPGN